MQKQILTDMWTKTYFYKQLINTETLNFAKRNLWVMSQKLSIMCHRIKHYLVYHTLLEMLTYKYNLQIHTNEDKIMQKVCLQAVKSPGKYIYKYMFCSTAVWNLQEKNAKRFHQLYYLTQSESRANLSRLFTGI